LLHRARRQPDFGGELLDFGRAERLVAARTPLELGGAAQHELHLGAGQSLLAHASLI
jgi:hypothetical protein